MASTTTTRLSFNTAEQFKESFYEPEPATIGYIYLANHVPYENEDVVPEAIDTVKFEKEIWDNMYAAKKITGNDVELVIPRKEWTPNVHYRSYDDTIELQELLTANASQNLNGMCIITSERNVYKCLSNGTSALSTIQPTGDYNTSNGTIATSDGYIWKYMYNVKPFNKFISNTWIPAPISTSKLDYNVNPTGVVPGQINRIVVTDSGSGYVTSNTTATAFTPGQTFIRIATLSNVSSNMAVSGTGISVGTHITSVDTPNNIIRLSLATTANGGGTNVANTVTISTRVYIIGDGTGATATANVQGGTLNSITMSTYGRDYSYANVRVFGSGTGANARIILTPQFGHGYNPAKELSANNVMIAVKIGAIDSTEGGLISTSTTFRQYGLLRDPYKYGRVSAANTTTSNTVISQTTDITLVSGTQYQLNEMVYQGTSEYQSFVGYVNAQTSNVVRLTKVRGTAVVGQGLIGENSATTRTVVNIKRPEFQPYTGDILYAENFKKVERANGQSENIRFVVRF
jgi:hypothetical protein